MEKFLLPLTEIETLQQINLEDILNTANDSEEGYILEVDLHYPDKVHDGYQDRFSFGSHQGGNFIQRFGEKQKELLQIMGETSPYSQSKKLIQTLADKKHYTVRYITL